MLDKKFVETDEEDELFFFDPQNKKESKEGTTLIALEEKEKSIEKIANEEQLLKQNVKQIRICFCQAAGPSKSPLPSSPKSGNIFLLNF